MAQLKEFYQKEVIPALTQQFGFQNHMRVPKITKVTLNMGVGEAIADKKVLGICCPISLQPDRQFSI